LRHLYLFDNLKVMPAALGTLELTTLLAVARLHEQAYGLAIRRDLAARTGRDYSVGAVYTTLQRLEDKGLLTSRHSEPLPIRGGRSRRYFTLTGAGERALREARRHATSIWAGIGKPLRPRLA
jgi:PadR family transcriptional regulator PadR